MVKIDYNGKSYNLASGESILECLLRHKVDYPHSCKTGVCQACLSKATSGSVKEEWQSGLQDTLKAQNYFLSCRARPDSDLGISLPNADECDVPAKIFSIEKLSDRMIKLCLLVDDYEKWTPGQYLNLINPDNLVRSYSIANRPTEDGFVELNIKLHDQGKMSQWLLKKAAVGMALIIRGPIGNCFYYNPKKLTFNMLLMGTGTGLAPLRGILKSALNEGHQGEITLLHGGVSDQDLYYVDELLALSREHENFHYANCVLEASKTFEQASIEDKVLDYLCNVDNLRVYVCGPQETTEKLKRKAFIAGVPSSNILSDAFI